MAGGDRWLSSGATVGQFLVQRFLAEGAHAQVYLAWDQKLARPVALKVFKLSGVHRDQMLAEARLTARFAHPHIVTVYDADVEGELTWLALEYLSDASLRARISPEGLPLLEALRLARPIAEALVEAHRRDVVHADLKPENVLLTEDGRLRVVDFGLARVVGDGNHTVSGTPAYLAPECWKGGAPTPAMDVWSLGVILHELLTGQRPVPEEQLAEFAARPTKLMVPPALAQLPSGAVIANALALEPSARPTARELLDALVVATRGDARGDRHPFRGLRSFTESDAADLVGRELDVDHALESMRREGVALIVGRSGLGKSSLLAAGLVPRLRESGAKCVTFRPGADPLRKLGGVLELHPSALEQLVARPALAATFAMRRSRLVILVDQLEESFTLAAPTARAAFFEALGALLESGTCRLVLALRDDHLGSLANALSKKVLAGTVVLQPLSREALAQAILQPLRRVGAGVDTTALVDRIVADVAHSPIALPLLQFVCQLLWDARDRSAGVLRLSDYEALGGAHGALAAHAERILDGLAPEDRRRARSLLLRLVTASGSRVPGREATLLEAVPGAAPVLARLLEERLLVATREPEDDSASIELAHEALIATWPSLRRWLEETQEDRTLRDDVEQAASRWHRQQERDDDTWSGDALLIALKRHDERPLGLSQVAQRFLEAGRQRDLTERRRARLRLGALFAGLLFVAVAGIVATLVTLSQQEQIRLAASNSGEFELRLHPFRLHLDGSREDVPLRDEIQWSLSPAPVSRSAGADAAPYSSDVLERTALGVVDGAARWKVRVPAAPALLRARVGSCPESVLRLEALPGYERSSRELHVVDVPLPVCSDEELVPIGAGPFLGEDGGLLEMPAFAIDRFEVTAARFDAWAALAPLTGEDAVPRPEFARADPQLPMVGVTAVQAEAFCRYLGLRLPTEEEWLKAARGALVLPDGGTNPAPQRSRPWVGDGQTNWAFGDAFGDLAPVGAFPDDVSPHGVFDLAGNVTEWTATPAASQALRGLRILRGGNWDTKPGDPDNDIAFANTRPALAVDYGVGFRCAATITPDGG